MFKDIQGYEKLYSITENGEVLSFKRKNHKLLSPSIRNGYKRVQLTDSNKVMKTFSVHRLVFETFCSSIPEDKEINHKDGDRQNNHVSNLEIVTRSQNILHQYHVLGAKGSQYGKKGSLSIKSRIHYFQDRNKEFVVDNLKEFCEKHNLNYSTMKALSSGKLKTHKQYTSNKRSTK